MLMVGLVESHEGYVTKGPTIWQSLSFASRRGVFAIPEGDSKETVGKPYNLDFSKALKSLS
jgi:hypothetical protein